MNNETEREAFEQTLNPHSRERNEVGEYVSAAARDAWSGFQAGAAYQRTQTHPLIKKWKCRHSAGENWFTSDRPGYWECVPIQEAQPVESYPHGHPLHKEVFMALDSSIGHDTFEDGVRGLIAELKEYKQLAQPADALVEALELLYRKLKPNVNGADETYFFIGLRDQVTERQMERISEALATYRAAQEKK